jgi:hypothetical protein
MATLAILFSRRIIGCTCPGCGRQKTICRILVRERQLMCCENYFMCQGSLVQVCRRICHPLLKAAVQPNSTLHM